MICIELFGGLGNQMFQYAFGAALAKARGTSLVLDTVSLDDLKQKENITPRQYALNIFPNITAVNATRQQINEAKPLHLRLFNYLVYKITGTGIRHSRYYVQNGFFFDDKIDRISNQCYVTGYWQSFKYQLSCEDFIRYNFTFPLLTDAINLDLLQKIEHVESISIHIRRSDYLSAHNIDTHGVCSLRYYNNAIEYIGKKYTDPVFFIFSDDMDWVMENLSIQFPHFFINHNKGMDSYRDMQLMSACKHNIIANSSFSWWGAWLNNNPSKTIIAPAKWFNNINDFKYSDLIPASWVSL